MRHVIKIAIATALMASVVCSASAIRVLRGVENCVETTLNQLTLPTDANGIVTLRTCPNCRTSTHRVTAATKFLFNNHEMPLEEFLHTASTARATADSGASVLAGVYLDVDTENVVRIALRGRAR